ncbi:hypothetical protein BpHYR1_035414 [Brachionus plicatilis]|uniref:Uncharacterized protein n=1 Tax=Brachionus plicatilis TaxID=10195 RepID=A0A3M7R1V6_BRAPC|nr:hypothetical protein BpHYR1_035414 [Brachionus plicatilis]
MPSVGNLTSLWKLLDRRIFSHRSNSDSEVTYNRLSNNKNASLKDNVDHLIISVTLIQVMNSLETKKRSSSINRFDSLGEMGKQCEKKLHLHYLSEVKNKNNKYLRKKLSTGMFNSKI